MVHKITPESDGQYIEEFRANPIAVHSPGLQRLLNVMRLYRGGHQPILVARHEFHDYVIGLMPPNREDPIVLEDHRVFKTREGAEWELFRRRWFEHTGEVIE
jgi:hypothetical protein